MVEEPKCPKWVPGSAGETHSGHFSRLKLGGFLNLFVFWRFRNLLLCLCCKIL
jgi:hypothetical protein